MDEQIFKDFLVNKLEIKDFIVTRSHLLRLCDLRMEGKITDDFLINISDYLIVSDYFTWDADSRDGEVVSETIFEWGNPDINYEINALNLRLWREYLQTGEYKLKDYSIWNSHIQRQREICKKVNSEWRPVNPKHKIGVANNLDGDPIHGLRHNPENGTAGWYIWTGEYSTEDDFFKPMHAGHLLQIRPDLIKYLGLQPGYRFLIDGKGYEDIWKDDTLTRT